MKVTDEDRGRIKLIAKLVNVTTIKSNNSFSLSNSRIHVFYLYFAVSLVIIPKCSIIAILNSIVCNIF